MTIRPDLFQFALTLGALAVFLWFGYRYNPWRK